ILLEGDEPAPAVPTESDPKFALGFSPKVPGVEPAGTMLPEAYGTKRLWLAARDPHCLYAISDLTLEQQGNYSALAIDRLLVLRVHLERVQGPGAIEMKLLPDRRYRFIPVAFAGQRYVVELGYFQRDQRWHSIAISEPVCTPQEGVAQDKTVRFANVPSRS